MHVDDFHKRQNPLLTAGSVASTNDEVSDLQEISDKADYSQRNGYKRTHMTLLT